MTVHYADECNHGTDISVIQTDAHCNVSLQHINGESCHCRFHPQHPKHVGGSRVSAALFPDIDSVKPTHQDGRGDISQKIRYYRNNNDF